MSVLSEAIEYARGMHAIIEARIEDDPFISEISITTPNYSFVVKREPFRNSGTEGEQA